MSSTSTPYKVPKREYASAPTTSSGPEITEPQSVTTEPPKSEQSYSTFASLIIDESRKRCFCDARTEQRNSKCQSCGRERCTYCPSVARDQAWTPDSRTDDEFWAEEEASRKRTLNAAFATIDTEGWWICHCEFPEFPESERPCWACRHEGWRWTPENDSLEQLSPDSVTE